jgi:serine/threonine protein kinase
VQGDIVDSRYVLGRSLGNGGMGEVYLAHDEVLDRDVALKVLRSRYAGDEEFAGRFLREARSAAGLSHPNIVQVYDRGETEDGISYIAMEYVPGGTLKDRIDGRAPIGTREAARMAARISLALEAAHERGVIHRDIKPQNVLVTPSGDLKVTDFGIARAASAVTSSASSIVFGTAAYISPEQAMGEPVGPASDLYSLGVVLYEMLTGELPYTADNSIAVCMKHVTEPLRPPMALNPAIPGPMNALVVKLLAKNPADRYASAAELLTDLERVGEGLPLVAEATTQPLRPPVAPSRVAGGRSGLRTLAVASVALLALLGAVLFDSLQGQAGQGSLPRAQGVTRDIIDPPKVTIKPARTGATNVHRDAPPAASASPSAPPTASPAASSAASPGASQAVPFTPPPDDDQTPAESQYGRSGT